MLYLAGGFPRSSPIQGQDAGCYWAAQGQAESLFTDMLDSSTHQGDRDTVEAGSVPDIHYHVPGPLLVFGSCTPGGAWDGEGTRASCFWTPTAALSGPPRAAVHLLRFFAKASDDAKQDSFFRGKAASAFP